MNGENVSQRLDLDDVDCSLKKWNKGFRREMYYLLMIVIGGNVTVIQDDTAVLPCVLYGSTESLTQITWQRRNRLIKTNTNFYTIVPENGKYFNGNDKRFSFVGNISVKNGSLQLSNVTLSDEGTYTCIYTLFPSGNYKTEIPLNVLGIIHLFVTVNVALCCTVLSLKVNLVTGTITVLNINGRDS
uniref:Ig-like domain-containing protein n=1 Tax=Neogobius melanostomus TaxID=47308 RepID=A0A8C6U2X9_9GOBI